MTYHYLWVCGLLVMIIKFHRDLKIFYIFATMMALPTAFFAGNAHAATDSAIGDGAAIPINAIKNQGFEEYIDNSAVAALWSLTASAGAPTGVERSEQDSDVHSGLAGVKITNIPQVTQVLYQQWIDYQPNKTYRLSFWGKVTSNSDTLRGYADIISRTAGGNWKGTLAGLSFNSSEWTRYAVTFSSDTVPERPLEVRASNLRSDMAGAIHFDDFSIIEVDRPTGPPGTPGPVTVLPGKGTLTISWGASAGTKVDSYRLFISTTNTFSSHVPGWNNQNVGDMTSVKVTGLADNTIYFVRLRAYNYLGGLSGYTSPSLAVTPGVEDEYSGDTAPMSGLPKYSDVAMRSINAWDGTIDTEDPSGSTVYPDTMKASRDFHCSQIVWSYVTPSVASHKNFVKQLTDMGIQFNLTNIVSVPPGKEKEWGLETRSGDPARRTFDGMLFGCRNKPWFVIEAILNSQAQIENLPLVSGTTRFAIHQDDPRVQASATKWGGCFCDWCSAKFSARCSDGKYQSNNGAFPVSTTVLKDLHLESLGDNEAFQAFARDTDEDYNRQVISALKSTAAKQGKQLVVSCNGGLWDTVDSPENPEAYQTLRHFDYWLGEVSTTNHHQQWFWTLRGHSKKFKKKIVTTSSEEFSAPHFRRIIAGSYAVGVNYIVPWDMYLRQPPALGRLYSAPENYADLYGFIRGAAEYLDGYEDVFGTGADIVDDRKDSQFGGLKPCEVSGASEPYAFVRAKPGQTDSPLVIHLVDWSDTPKAATVTVRAGLLVPNKQPSVRLLTPKPYNAPDHETAESSKDYGILVSSETLAIDKISGGDVSVRVPPMMPWGILVIAPSSINPPVNVNVQSTSAREAQLNFGANENPAGTEYRIFLSSTGEGEHYVQVLSTTSLSPRVSGLAPNTTYYAKVMAVQDDGNLSWPGVLEDPFRTLNNFVDNPGFEENGTGTIPAFWETTGTAHRVKRAIGAGEFHDGTAGLVIENSTSPVETFQTAGIQSWEGYSPGKTYQLTFWGKVSSPDLKGGVGLILRNTSGVFQSTLTDHLFDGTVWSKYGVTFSTDAVTPRPFELRAHNLSPTTPGSIFFDDISIAEVTRPTAPPGKPGNVKVVGEQGGISVSWDRSAEDLVDGYRIAVSTASNFSSNVNGWINRNVGDMDSVHVTGLKDNTTYYARLRAYNAISGYSSYSTIAFDRTHADITPPSQPGDLSPLGNEKSVHLSWSASKDTGGSGVIGYEVSLSTDPQFSLPVSGWSFRDVGDTTSVVVDNLSRGTTYYVRLRAKDGAGNVSPVSTASAATWPTPQIVVISEPSAYASFTLPNVLKVSADILDGFIVDRVEFYLDGVLLGTDTQAPFEIQDPLDETKIGPHTLTVTSYELNGDKCSDTISLTVLLPTYLLNIRDEGAKGDGVTDDTNAIKNAMLKGVPIFFPPGIYRVTEELSLSPSTRNTHFIGSNVLTKLMTATSPDESPVQQGSESVILYDGEPTEPVAVIRASYKNVEVPPIQNVDGAVLSLQIRNMTIDANKKADYGLYIARVMQPMTVSNVVVKNAIKDGLFANYTYFGLFEHITATGNGRDGVSVGKQIGNSANIVDGNIVNNTTWRDISVEGNTRHGMRAYFHRGNVVMRVRGNTVIEGATDYSQPNAFSNIDYFGDDLFPRYPEPSYVNVKDFNAMGDGLTNDFAAIQAAMAFNKPIYFPPGKYRVEDELVIPAGTNNVAFIGAGTSQWPYTVQAGASDQFSESMIFYDGPENADKAVVRASASPVTTEPTAEAQGFKMFDIGIDGNNKAGYGIAIANVVNPILSGVSVRGTRQDGLYVNKIKSGRFELVTLNNNYGNGVSLGRAKMDYGWLDADVSHVLFRNVGAPYNGNNFSFYELGSPRGYGVGAWLGTDNRLVGICAETNDGPNFVFGSWNNGNKIFGAYSEQSSQLINPLSKKNAVEEGRTKKSYGVWVLNPSQNSSGQDLDSFFLFQISGQYAEWIRLQGEAPATPVKLKNVFFGAGIVTDWDPQRFLTLENVYSNLTSVHIEGIPPLPPENLRVMGTDGLLNLAWDEAVDRGVDNIGVSGVKGYRIDISTDGFNTFVDGWRNKEVGVSISTSIAGLKAGATYSARVRAEDNAGNISDTHQVISAIIKPIKNPGFEDYFENPFTPAHWNLMSSPGSAIAIERSVNTEEAHGGLAGLKITNIPLVTQVAYQPWTDYEKNKTYQLSFWGKVSSGTDTLKGVADIISKTVSGSYKGTIAGVLFNDADWTKYSITFTTNTTPERPLEVRVYNSPSNGEGTVHFDDISISEVARPAGPPNPPTRLTAIPGQEMLSISWDRSLGSMVDSYRIFISTLSTFATHIPGWNNRNVGDMDTIQVKGLANSTTYYIRLRAYNALGGLSPYSERLDKRTLDDTTPPSRPENIQAIVEEKSVQLSWSPSVDNGGSGLSGYLLDVSTLSSFNLPWAQWDRRDLGPVLSTPVAGLQSNTHYYFRLFAKDNAGNISNPSDTFEANTLIDSNSIPTAISISATDTSITGVWSPVSKATHYILKAAHSFSGSSIDTIMVSTNPHATINDLLPNTLYDVVLTACDSQQCSSETPLGDIVTFARIPLLTVTGNTGRFFEVSIDKKDNPLGTEYIIQRSVEESPFDSILTTTAVSSISIDLPRGKKSALRVLAKNQRGDLSEASASVSIETAPSEPTLQSIGKITDSTIEISWFNTTGSSRYLLGASRQAQRPADFDFFIETAEKTAELRGLASNTRYYLFLKAMNDAGESDFVDLGPVITRATKPTLSLGALLGSTVTLHIDPQKNPENTVYEIEVSFDGSDFDLIETTTSLSLSVPLSHRGQPHTFRAHAINLAGVKSEEAITTTIYLAPERPTHGQITSVSATEINLSWDTSGGATNYRAIAALNSSSPFINPVEKQTSLTQTQFQGLLPNTSYYVFVQSGNPGGESDFLLLDSTLTLAAVPSLQIKQKADTYAEITIDANGNPSQTFYEIERSEKGNDFRSLGKFDSLIISIPSLSPGVSTSFRARAFNSAGTSSVYSSTVEITITDRSPDTVKSVRCFPNPLRASDGNSKIIFDRLPSKSELRIYSLQGKLINSFQTETETLIWDTSSQDGSLVSSGVYLAAIQGEGGMKLIKVLIQR